MSKLKSLDLISPLVTCIFHHIQAPTSSILSFNPAKHIPSASFFFFVLFDDTHLNPSNSSLLFHHVVSIARCHNDNNLPTKTHPSNHRSPSHIWHFNHRPILFLRSSTNFIPHYSKYFQERLRSRIPFIRNFPHQIHPLQQTNLPFHPPPKQ